MNNSNFYPRSINEIKEVIKINKKIYFNEELIAFLKWEKWFNRVEKKINVKLNNTEFLKIFFYNDQYSLQVWQKKQNYHVILYNLVTNYFDEFNTENTLIIK